MPKPTNQRSLYNFLRAKKRDFFTFDQLMKATDYDNPKSARVLLRGTWTGAIELYDAAKPKRWRVRREFASMSFEDFEFAISHAKTTVLERHVSSALARDLLARVQPQARTAIELLNRPGFQSRTEAFLLLFVNAWELMLKAEVVEERGWDAIFVNTKSGKKKRSTSFEMLVKQLPEDTKAAAAQRAQLTDLYELRNEAAHLVRVQPGSDPAGRRVRG